MDKIENVEISYLGLEEYDELKQAMITAYPTMEDSYWAKEEIENLLDVFPEGQVVIKVNDAIAGCALSVIVSEQTVNKYHAYEDIITDGTFEKFDAKGNVLYGIEVFISPEYRGLRLGRRLYDYRKELCERLNLKGIMFGGRIPNYHKYAHQLSPKDYIEKVKHREIDDPVLSFQLSNDFHVSRILKNYLLDDEASKYFAVLLEWDNIYYEKPTEEPVSDKTVARVGLVQWQMRTYKNRAELMQQVQFFVDTLASYNCDFALFPELFNMPLMPKDASLSPVEAIRELAKHTEAIKNEFSQLAVSCNINIISGSMPVIRDGNLYNEGYLCKRDGHVESYEKIHITPDEVSSWGMRGGSKIQTFDTDSGKIGVVICYDSEFPELARILAQEGMDILFVPFMTDTANAFSRVRNCAMARAIENECYVAIAGSVGNLPQVTNMNIQYAQSMVFTPCDFAFPIDGVQAKATPNTEMVVITDVDLTLLRELNKTGSVRNLAQRRTDLYDLRKK